MRLIDLMSPEERFAHAGNLVEIMRKHDQKQAQHHVTNPYRDHRYRTALWSVTVRAGDFVQTHRFEKKADALTFVRIAKSNKNGVQQ